jgi:CBS domain-containing protein
VKLAIRLGGEIGRNFTDEDVVASWTVADAMSKDLVPIEGTTPLREVFQVFSEHDYLMYPVAGADGRIAGIISLESLKHALMDQDVWEWVVAFDVMTSAVDKVTSSMPLKAAMDLMRHLHIEQIPVVDDMGEDTPVGLLDMPKAGIMVEEEVSRRLGLAAGILHRSRNSEEPLLKREIVCDHIEDEGG